tara:strand:+ start:403 stop:621 length:219 start_codon:yes stop_codon:yes gene_type:complete
MRYIGLVIIGGCLCACGNLQHQAPPLDKAIGKQIMSQEMYDGSDGTAGTAPNTYRLDFFSTGELLPRTGAYD